MILPSGHSNAYAITDGRKPSYKHLIFRRDVNRAVKPFR
ncbi:MAG: hypothetical protein OJF47_001470 [Nitrospira sp.]|nr:MAG: hypothetical protein OJF47_001470 [Nitrospira sp.]